VDCDKGDMPQFELCDLLRRNERVRDVGTSDYSSGPDRDVPGRDVCIIAAYRGVCTTDLDVKTLRARHVRAQDAWSDAAKLVPHKREENKFFATLDDYVKTHTELPLFVDAYRETPEGQPIGIIYALPEPILQSGVRTGRVLMHYAVFSLDDLPSKAPQQTFFDTPVTPSFPNARIEMDRFLAKKYGDALRITAYGAAEPRNGTRPSTPNATPTPRTDYKMLQAPDLA
jgi:hypothetical protein